ncbi:MAG: RnfABCDGE type electron transport complex subunit D [Candidatus Micrarchaeota archaeon]|nr:RnfABCDGE type electron transport complex subunit D [Candidatus Micrarchaeota archaeon]
MKILGQHIGAMYLWAIAILIALAAFSSYALGVFPIPLILAVIICSVVEVLVYKVHRKHAIRIPYSGIITGLIIGSVAPYNAPLIAVLVASVVAVLTKVFVKTKHGNIFNPAVIGLLVGLAVFSLGDAWWTASSYGVLGIAVPLSLLFVIAAYLAKRLIAAAAFVAAIVVISMATSNSAISLLTVESAVLNVNYFFALLMLADPKTSPHKNSAQIIYGAGIALVSSLLLITGIAYGLLIALLVGNLGYLLYRKFG